MAITNSDIAGTYSLVSFSHQDGKDEAQSGTITINSNGTWTNSGTYNREGTISTGTGSGTYTLAADGTLLVTPSDEPSAVYTGHAASSGVITLTMTAGSVYPETAILVKQGGTHTAASVAGSYTVVSYSHQNGIDMSMVGTVTLTSSGSYTNNATWNENGRISQDTGTGTFTVASNGAITVYGSENPQSDPFRGYVSSSGVVVLSEMNARFGPEIDLLIPNAGSFSAASIAGRYSYVNYHSDGGIDGATVGQVTLSSNGTYSTVATEVSNGTVRTSQTGSGTFTVTSSGVVTAQTADGSTLTGHASSGGLLVLSQTKSGEGPEIVVLVRNEAGTLSGTTGADTLTAGAGEVINGGVGTDVANYTSARASYTVTYANSTITIANKTGTVLTDTLTNVERVKFSDGTLAFDIAKFEPAGEAYRLYQAAFKRTPDTGGLSYWVGQLDGGQTNEQVAHNFIVSNEFKTLYGSNPTNGELITAFYRNVLDRAPDQGGYDYWLGLLNNKQITAEQLLINFSESTENIALVASATQNGIWLG